MALGGMGTGARLRQLRDDLVAARPSGASWASVDAWAAKAKPFFVKRLHDHLDEFEKRTRPPRWLSLPRVGGAEGSEAFNSDARAKENRSNSAAALQAHDALVAFLDGLLAEDDDSGRDASRPAAAPATLEVFVVHGRDEGAKQSVARVLQTLGLEPVILHERPNAGRTLIEKFEHHASGSGFAVVLLTGDDVGSLVGAPQVQRRARQNVILELGYFYGRLGRGRVVALVDPAVERPSDIDGIVWIDLDARGAWRLELVRELRAAGYEVDANRLS